MLRQLVQPSAEFSGRRGGAPHTCGYQVSTSSAVWPHGSTARQQIYTSIASIPATIVAKTSPPSTSVATTVTKNIATTNSSPSTQVNMSTISQSTNVAKASGRSPMGGACATGAPFGNALCHNGRVASQGMVVASFALGASSTSFLRQSFSTLPSAPSTSLATSALGIDSRRVSQAPEPECIGTVLCFGDSLTAGLNAQGGNYPMILENLLRDAGCNVKVRNTGNWGDNTAQLLMRLPYVISDQASRGQIKCILILGGINDIIRGGFYCSELLEKLESLHEVAGNAPGNPYVGVLTLPPAQVKPVKETARLHVNEKLRESCKAHPRRFLVDLGDVPFELSSDGLHYSAEGYREFAERVVRAMHASGITTHLAANST